MPLRRYIFNTLTVVSLLLLLGTLGLWFGSYSPWRSDAMNMNEGIFVASRNGKIWIGYVSYESSKIPTIRNTLLGIGFAKDTWTILTPNDIASGRLLFTNERAVLIPHWSLTLIFAILPAIWLFKWNKRRNLGPNACLGCGYNLRGNETGKCPECGHASETETAQA